MARESLRSAVGLAQKPAQIPDDPQLLQPRACFVTLTINDELRGCIGTLEAYRPLYQDLAENSRASALRDPRFPPLREQELEAVEIHISILSPPEPMEFRSEVDLLEQIRPGVDGLILTEGGHRGTFLPSVWEQLPTPELFLGHLKQKAGLPPTYWSNTLEISRYTTESFGAPYRQQPDH